MSLVAGCAGTGVTPGDCLSRERYLYGASHLIKQGDSDRLLCRNLWDGSSPGPLKPSGRDSFIYFRIWQRFGKLNTYAIATSRLRATMPNFAQYQHPAPLLKLQRQNDQFTRHQPPAAEKAYPFERHIAGLNTKSRRTRQIGPRQAFKPQRLRHSPALMATPQRFLA